MVWENGCGWAAIHPLAAEAALETKTNSPPGRAANAAKPNTPHPAQPTTHVPLHQHVQTPFLKHVSVQQLSRM